MTRASGGLVVASLVDGRPLCNTVVVALPDDVGVSREIKQALDRFSATKLDIHILQVKLSRLFFHIPDFDVAPPVNPRPHTQNIFAASDTQHSAADFISGLCKLVANHSQEEILPVSIGNTLLETYDPLTSPLVRLIFPDGANALLEDMVIGNRGKKRRTFKMRVHRPEALYGRYRSERDGRLFVVGVFGCGRAIPNDPRRLQRVLTRSSDGLVLKGLAGSLIVFQRELPSGCFQLGATGSLRRTE